MSNLGLDCQSCALASLQLCDICKSGAVTNYSVSYSAPEQSDFEEPEQVTFLEEWIECKNCQSEVQRKDCDRFYDRENWELSWILYTTWICPHCGHDMEDI